MWPNIQDFAQHSEFCLTFRISTNIQNFDQHLLDFADNEDNEDNTDKLLNTDILDDKDLFYN